MWHDGYPGDYDAMLRRRADEYWEDRFSGPALVEYEVLVGTDLEKMRSFWVEAADEAEAVQEALDQYEAVGEASVYDDIFWRLYLDGILINEETGDSKTDYHAV